MKILRCHSLVVFRWVWSTGFPEQQLSVQPLTVTSWSWIKWTCTRSFNTTLKVSRASFIYAVLYQWQEPSQVCNFIEELMKSNKNVKTKWKKSTVNLQRKIYCLNFFIKLIKIRGKMMLGGKAACMLPFNLYIKHHNVEKSQCLNPR